MRAIAGLPRVLGLVGALARDITRVPFGAGWGRTILSLPLHISCLDLSGDRLYGLHETGRVKFRPNAGPGCVAIVQVIEDPGAVVPGPVPGKGAVVRVRGEHGCQLEEMQKMLQSTIYLRVRHLGSKLLSGCQDLPDVPIAVHHQVGVVCLNLLRVVNLAESTIVSRTRKCSSGLSHTLEIEELT